MHPIQTDISDSALITAIRANLCEFYRHVSRSLHEQQFENDRFTRWQAPIAHPWFNGVLSSQPSSPRDRAFVEECIEYFRAKQIVTFTWWMEPHLARSDWEPLLSPYGFGFSDDTPGMAAYLDALNESAQTVDRLEVRVVADDVSLRAWAHVFTLGYGLPSDWEHSVYKLAVELGLGFPIRNYLGYWDGEPVATCCHFFGAGVAGIYSVSTLPAARGKGIGTAMTLQAFRKARELGYRIGVLQSSEMGYNIYKKLGLRHLCQIEYFYCALQ